MMKRIKPILLFLLLAASMILHYWEFRKIQDFSRTFALQAEIETKRTALMVIYQTVLKNMAKELDDVKKRQNESSDELKWEENNQ
ncbi:MAG: hypothetical protein IKO93_03935 [Lentisphaeria bacterium]|nr:hypothetical protein [Lentisphaeria bacterium]